MTSTKDFRNFTLVGHGTSGKTVLADAMLKCGKEITRIGKTEDGSTTSDYQDNEIKRQISIGVSMLNCDWKGAKFNILDAPGFLDFVGDTQCSLRVSDFAVVVVNATSGPGAGTSVAWEICDKYKLPKFVAINMLDKENTQFDKVVEQLKERYSNRIVPMLIPLNAGPGFCKLADVLKKKQLTFKTDSSGEYTEEDLPADWQDKIDTMHEELIECVAESDDALLEKFFEQGELTEAELQSGMSAAIKSGSVIPLVATSAATNVGVSRLMDLIAEYAPTAADAPAPKATKNGKEVEIKTDANAPAAMFIFKTVSVPHAGEVSFFRVYAGTIKSGLELENTISRNSERIGQIYKMNGKTRKEVKEFIPGDMGAVVKLKSTHTGDTLCDSKLDVQLEKIDFPLPNISAAVITKSKGDEDKIATGLANIHEEDPMFVYKVDPELSQTIISGQGELHLEVVVDKLKNKFHVEALLVEPRIPYRETIKGKGEAKYRHKKQSGGAGQFGEVWMTVEPLKRGQGIEFTNTLVGQNVDRVFVPSVEKGVNAACKEGPIAGYKVVDVKAIFYDGKQHPVDSKDIAFQIAGKGAFKDAFSQAKPCLLEPIFEVEIEVPEAHMGDVMGDISSRRGKILGMDSIGKMQIIRANIPQANLYRYSTTLRSLTGGQARHKEKFSHYDEMPRDIEKKVIEARKKEKEEDAK